jgi:hypothetical protein
MKASLGMNRQRMGYLVIEFGYRLFDDSTAYTPLGTYTLITRPLAHPIKRHTNLPNSPSATFGTRLPLCCRTCYRSYLSSPDIRPLLKASLTPSWALRVAPAQIRDLLPCGQLWRQPRPLNLHLEQSCRSLLKHSSFLKTHRTDKTIMVRRKLSDIRIHCL